MAARGPRDKIDVCLLGCGAIASQHARALRDSAAYRLFGCYDIDFQRARTFSAKWGAQHAFETWQAALGAGAGAYVIASSTDSHIQQALSLLDAGAPTILCEKPITKSWADLRLLRERAAKSSSRIVVNFQRRFDVSHRSAAAEARSGRLGSFRFFHANVSRGLIHNGSHMFDLIDAFVGLPVKIVPGPSARFLEGALGNGEGDWFGSYDVLCENGAVGSVECPEALEFSLFELALVYSGGMIELRDLGREISLSTARPSADFPGYFDLVRERAWPNTLMSAFDSLYDWLPAAPSSEVRAHWDSAVRTHELLLSFEAKQSQDEKWD